MLSAERFSQGWLGGTLYFALSEVAQVAEERSFRTNRRSLVRSHPRLAARVRGLNRQRSGTIANKCFISGRHDRGRVGICSLSGRRQSWRPLLFVLSAFYIFIIVFTHQLKKPLKYAIFSLLASLPIISILGIIKPAEAAAAAAANKERLTRSRQQRRRFRVFPAVYPTNKTIVKNI